MAFPASTEIPATGYDEMAYQYQRAKSLAGAIKKNSENVISELSGTVNAEQMLNWYQSLYDTKNALVAIASRSIIEHYAIALENNPGLNIVAEFQTMMAAISAVLSWMYAALSGTEWLRVYAVNASGQVSPRPLPPEETAPLIGLLQTLADSID